MTHIAPHVYNDVLHEVGQAQATQYDKPMAHIATVLPEPGLYQAANMLYQPKTMKQYATQFRQTVLPKLGKYQATQYAAPPRKTMKQYAPQFHHTVMHALGQYRAT